MPTSTSSPVSERRGEEAGNIGALTAATGCAIATGIGAGEASGETAAAATGSSASPRNPAKITTLRIARITHPVEPRGRQTNRDGMKGDRRLPPLLFKRCASLVMEKFSTSRLQALAMRQGMPTRDKQFPPRAALQSSFDSEGRVVRSVRFSCQSPYE